MSYTPTFIPEYENGWENLPSEDTPITAEALNGYDGAIEAIETYLADNDIVAVEANPAGAASESLSTIDIGGTVYSVSGGSSTFAGLSDVSLTNLQNGQVPVYNSTSQKWENGSGGGGGNTNMWTGTQAQYTAQASSIADGTLVNITDDETHVQAYDVYSTTEQVIGTFLGETLYRKVITGLNISLGQNVWTTLTGVTITNGKDLIDAKCYGEYSEQYVLNCTKVHLNSVDGSVEVRNIESDTTLTALMLEYTKKS